jgi:hypothetical protein
MRLQILHTLTVVFLLFTGLTLVAQANQSNDDLARFPLIADETDPMKLVRGIVMEDCVVESAVGIAGAYTIQYARYERLCEIAGDSLLIQLTKHENNAVKVYAYRCLRHKSPLVANLVKRELESKPSKVCWFTGCTKVEVLLFELINYP